MPEFVYTMKDLNKVVPPRREILKGIWLSFYYGAKIGVLGLNGAGKSSLLRIMAGEDDDFIGEAFPAAKATVGMLSQEPSLDPEKSVKLGRALEAGIPFAERTGVQVVELDRGYVKMKMPFEPNVNHVGMMYAGALFTLAEVPGGAIFLSTFDAKRYYPIVKDLKIKFVKPAMTDITVEVRLTDEDAARIAAEADAKGKADYAWECELKDADGNVVAVTQNTYQMRAHPKK